MEFIFLPCRSATDLDSTNLNTNQNARSLQLSHSCLASYFHCYCACIMGQNYRTYKQEWRATPYTTPSLVVNQAASADDLTECAGSSSSTSSLRGYVSWNGTTDVTSYVVYPGSSNSSLEEIGTIPKQGFETKFALPAGVKAVQVGAVEDPEKGVVTKSGIVLV